MSGQGGRPGRWVVQDDDWEDESNPYINAPELEARLAGLPDVWALCRDLDIASDAATDDTVARHVPTTRKDRR